MRIWQHPTAVGLEPDIGGRLDRVEALRPKPEAGASGETVAFVRRSAPLEVGEHQEVEELGAGTGAERLKALAERLLHLLEGHDRTLVRQGAPVAGLNAAVPAAVAVSPTTSWSSPSWSSASWSSASWSSASWSSASWSSASWSSASWSS